MVLVWDFVREIASWILSRRERFHQGDGFQLIVGWPEIVRQSARQIGKIGGDFDKIARIAASDTFADHQSISDDLFFYRGWDASIFK